MYAKGGYNKRGPDPDACTPTLPTTTFLDRPRAPWPSGAFGGRSGLSEGIGSSPTIPLATCGLLPLRNGSVRQPSLQWSTKRTEREKGISGHVRHPPLQTEGCRASRTSATSSQSEVSEKSQSPLQRGRSSLQVEGKKAVKLNPQYANSPYNDPKKRANAADFGLPRSRVRQLPLQQGVMVRRPPLLGTPTPILWEGFVRQPPLLGTPCPLHWCPGEPMKPEFFSPSRLSRLSSRESIPGGIP